MNDLQKELFTIYLETRKVCDQLNIKLIASGGTLLGAIRHKGFIPWDDDMDFYMLRNDYDKFIKKAPKLIDKKYFVQSHKTDHDWYKGLCRVRKNKTSAFEDNPYVKYHQGLWIDIFPLDIVPENENEYIENIIKARDLFDRIVFHWYQEASTFKTKIKRILFGYRRLLVKHPFLSLTYRKFEKLTIKYNKSNNKTLGLFYFIVRKDFATGRLFIYPKDFFDNLIEVPFEDSTVTVNSEYDKFLTQQYGNWHQFPPLDKRKESFHNIVFCDFNKDYREYIKDKEFKAKIRKKV